MASTEKKAFFDLAEAIARELNPPGDANGWESLGLVRAYYEGQPDEYASPLIAHPDGRKIYLEERCRADGKLCVSGTWPSYDSEQKASDNSAIKHRVTPRELPYENGKPVPSPSINVSVARGVAAIARDIQRRFLPEYTRIWNLCKAAADKNAEYRQRSETAWASVCKHFGDDKAQNKSFSMHVADTYVNFEKAGASVRINAHGLPAPIVIELIDFFFAHGGK